MLKKIGIALLAIILIFVVVVALQPADFKIERSKSIPAPPEVVFSLVNDFHDWPAWSPWEKLDPNMKKTHSGAPLGKGAMYAWAGNDEVGEGRMTITESEPNRLVGLKLEFLKPFEATNQTTFTFGGGGNSTNVTWAMTGKNNFISKAFSMFVDMDAMVGKDFEKGLTELGAVSVAEAKKREVEAKKP
jgi:uncharacterized protein YndB with AHSA1/START domain